MTAYLFYTIGSPGEQTMRRLADQLQHYKLAAEMVNADSPRGSQLAETYDVLARPAVVLAASDGTIMGRWDDALPQPGDVAYLAGQL